MYSWYGVDQMQDRDRPEKLAQKSKQMIGQENKGREGNYVACVLRVSDSQILKQNSVLLLLLCTALCFMVVA